ncbi:MAG: cation diffusion facilitator family transporter [Nitrospinota bacterium]|nr:cation diffusion facilitator family transporter [Nitrospinota bacterium]
MPLARNEGIKIILQGIAVNIFLAAVKFVGGVLGKSTALIADSFHSLSDLLTDVVVLFSHRIGQMPKDEGHPYGHGRAETIGSVIIGSAIVLVALGLVYKFCEVILLGKLLVPEWTAAGAAGLSILTKEWLFHYTRKVGERIRSPAIVANAWHHRSDAISSIACLVGIIGAMQGVLLLDPLSGGLVALMIGKVGIEISLTGLRDLMDSSLEEEAIQRLNEIIGGTSGVQQFHDLRTRRVGGKMHVDVHILVDPGISVTEGHNISENVRHHIKQDFPNAEDILLHVDAEDMLEMEAPYPVTREALDKVTQPIISSAQGIAKTTRMQVHYLEGKNIVEFFVHVDENKTVEETKEILKNLKTRLEALEEIDNAKVYLDVDSAQAG